MVFYRRFVSVVAFILSMQLHNSRPQFTIKAEEKKAADESCLFKTFSIKTGNIADCLGRCLENCRCQSFQVCQNTKCQLCSSHKEENSSLLHDKNGCIYATYEMRNYTESNVEQTKRQCSNTRCAMKRNCCKEPSLCHQNERCKPLNSLAKPWKRFTCECKDGYHGNTCEPIRSCQGYANSSQPSDWYKVVNTSAGSLVKVYCHFDSHRAWTLTPLGKSKNSTQCFSVTK